MIIFTSQFVYIIYNTYYNVLEVSFISYVCLLLIYLISFARFDSNHLLIDHDSTILSSVEVSPIQQVYRSILYVMRVVVVNNQCNPKGFLIILHSFYI